MSSEPRIIVPSCVGFGLESELADHPVSGEPANFLEHIDSIGNVDIIPEFPSILMVALFLVLATTAVAFSKKSLKPTTQIV
ncbi:hypothetical protein MUP38_04230 [Candidatus Bathyarchaeota archaeon]|nr:hypothetical protein [Candidatus Bathyarchaeota archaeon]